MSVRRISLLFLAMIFALTSLQPLSADSKLSGIFEKVPTPTKEQYVIYFNQSSDGFTSARYSHRVTKPNPDNPGASLPHYEAVLPACLSQSDVTCVESLESKKVNEKVWTKGFLSPNQLDITKVDLSKNRNDFEYTTWAADKISTANPASKALPAGGVASSWELPNASHSQGASYLAEVVFLDSLVGLGDGPRFSVNVEPWNWNCTSVNSCDYLGTTVGPSGMIIPADTEFRITVRLNHLTQRIGKWAIGRLEKPTISLKGERLVISGAPVSYPMGYSLVNLREECSNALQDIWKKYFPRAGNLCSVGSGYSTDSNDASSVPIFDVLGEKVKEYGRMQRWSFSTIPTKSFSNNCLNSQDFSLASSNAMLYSNQPPTWNKSDGTLSYRIASTHLDSSGQINRGNYSLAIPKLVADCLWSFDVSKGSAVISITNSSGTQNIAISALRTTPDWVYFDASGFTFSSPEIKVKFVAAGTQLPGKVVKLPTTSSVTCSKGKAVKVVKGIDPKCPAGYQKKK